MNEKRDLLIFTLLWCLMLAFILSGCAGTPSFQKELDRQALLIDAGFTRKIADTPEKLAHLKTLPQKKLIKQEVNGKPLYVYADAEDCQCMVVGNAEAYAMYKNMVRQMKTTEEMDTVEADMNAPVLFTMWGIDSDALPTP